MLKKIMFILSIMLINSAFATYITPQEAFGLQLIEVQNNKVDIHFTIKSGYDIYQDKIHVEANPSSGVKVGNPIFPTAIVKHNDIIGDYSVYEDSADILLPIIDYGNNNLVLDISYQGCKGLDYCYPAINETKSLILKKASTQKIIANTIKTTSPNSLSLTSKFSQLKDANNIKTITNFFSNSFILVVLGFFLVGILLAFTPCVFPMLPILFTIVAGQNATFKRSVALSTSYVLGMASAYSLAGLIFAKFGGSLQVWLQNQYINYLLAFIFVVFSLSLFGLFELKLPAKIQEKLFQNQSHSGSIFRTYVTGIISSLILSPCITAPIAGALLYIATTGNVALGMTALFAMGVGSGLPLLIIAVFGNKILPKNGVWMLIIKDILAFVMIAMSVYVVARNESTAILTVSLGGLLLFAGIYFFLSNKYNSLKQKWIFIILNIILIISASVLIQHTIEKSMYERVSVTNSQNTLNFITVNNLTALNQELTKARQVNKPVMLDFSASWCLACKEMDETTFKDIKVTELLRNFYLIRVDLSINNEQSKELENKFNVFAPPTLIFIDKNGVMISNNNVIGYIGSDKLIAILNTFI